MNHEATRTARDLAQVRAANQQKFPFAARMVAELRKFFPGAKVTYAREGGREVGRRYG